MTPASIAIDAVIRSVDKGLAIEAAARILRDEADATDQHPKISTALRVTADALEKHPNPRALLSANLGRYNAEVACGDPESWGTVRAFHITAAAMAFERALEAMAQV